MIMLNQRSYPSSVVSSPFSKTRNSNSATSCKKLARSISKELYVIGVEETDRLLQVRRNVGFLFKMEESGLVLEAKVRF